MNCDSFKSPIWPVQKDTDKPWRMIVHYHKLNLVVIQIATAFQMVLGLEQINTCPGIWHIAIELPRYSYTCQ